MFDRSPKCCLFKALTPAPTYASIVLDAQKRSGARCLSTASSACSSRSSASPCVCLSPAPYHPAFPLSDLRTKYIHRRTAFALLFPPSHLSPRTGFAPTRYPRCPRPHPPCDTPSLFSLSLYLYLYLTTPCSLAESKCPPSSVFSWCVHRVLRGRGGRKAAVLALVWRSCGRWLASESVGVASIGCAFLPSFVYCVGSDMTRRSRSRSSHIRRAAQTSSARDPSRPRDGPDVEVRRAPGRGRARRQGSVVHAPDGAAVTVFVLALSIPRTRSRSRYAGAAWLGGSGSEPQWDRRLDVEGQWRLDVEAQQHSAIEVIRHGLKAIISDPAQPRPLVRSSEPPDVVAEIFGHMDVDEYGDEHDSSFIQRYFGALEAFSARKTSKCRQYRSEFWALTGVGAAAATSAGGVPVGCAFLPSSVLYRVGLTWCGAADTTRRASRPHARGRKHRAERITISLSAYSPRGTDLKLAGRLRACRVVHCVVVQRVDAYAYTSSTYAASFNSLNTRTLTSGTSRARQLLPLPLPLLPFNSSSHSNFDNANSHSDSNTRARLLGWFRL
ncbi:hypothetical protein B0H10DRAFT_2226383 [Mycena sp. CBHHK59/15]|nr:hypothetical protein B0H10DRAFT_2226383 [Mycena sp. CBHHK59/15]